ncbi:hypothetical protein GGR58DRAFT_268211 [Xylaria digitata]|nr:hypothetical protein GGR58DRAFT_268211 [Xylaria digitata]
MLSHHFPAEADVLMKKRYRIINIWRPLEQVQNWPLAFCDGRTVRASDLITADRVRQEFVGEGLWSLKDPTNEWYYWPDQKPNEIVLLKIADSRVDIPTRRK